MFLRNKIYCELDKHTKNHEIPKLYTLLMILLIFLNYFALSYVLKKFQFAAVAIAVALLLPTIFIFKNYLQQKNFLSKLNKIKDFIDNRKIDEALKTTLELLKTNKEIEPIATMLFINIKFDAPVCHDFFNIMSKQSDFPDIHNYAQNFNQVYNLYLQNLELIKLSNEKINELQNSPTTDTIVQENIQKLITKYNNTIDISKQKIETYRIVMENIYDIFKRIAIIRILQNEKSLIDEVELKLLEIEFSDELIKNSEKFLNFQREFFINLYNYTNQFENASNLDEIEKFKNLILKT